MISEIASGLGQSKNGCCESAYTRLVWPHYTKISTLVRFEGDALQYCLHDGVFKVC